MNSTDARKLSEAIESLTRQLRRGGSGPSTDTTTPNTNDSSNNSSTNDPQTAREVLEIRQRLLRTEYEINEEVARLGEMSKEELDRLEITLKNTTDLERGQQAVLDVLEKTSKEREKEVKLAKEAMREQKRMAEREEERLRVLEDTEDVVGNIFQGIMKQSKLKPDPKRGLAGFLRTVLVNKDAREEALSKFHDQIREFKSLLGPMNLFTAGLEGMGAALMSVVTLGFGALVRAIQAAVEFIVFAALKFDSLGAEIAKTTGHGRDFAEEIIDLAGETKGLTANLDDMVPIVLKLQNSLMTAGNMTRATSSSFKDIALTAERMGVSVSETAAFIRDMMVGAGASVDETKESFANLNAAASLMGKNFNELASDFLSNRTAFAAYGHNMQKVFLRSLSVSRQLGVELQSVIGLSDRFKTFEDAAAFVSEFNHMIGASLDPLEMMRIRAEEGPEGVARAIKESLDASGKSFDELSFAMREGIADNLNMPMNELRNLMEGKMNLALTDEVENATQPLDAFLDKGRETMKFMEQLGTMLKQVAFKIGKAFGFDKIFGGSEGISGVMKHLQNFIDTDLTSAINVHLVPFVREDLVPAIKGLGHFIKGLTNNSMVRSILNLDEVEARSLASDAKLSAQEGETIESALRIKDKTARETALDKLGFHNEKTRQEDARARVKKLFEQANLKMRQSRELANLDSLTMNPFATFGEAFSDGQEYQQRFFQRTPQTAKKNMGIQTVLEDGVFYAHKDEMLISKNAFGRGGAPFSNPSSTSGAPSETRVNVVINVDDRRLKDVFTATVEKVLVGEAY